MLFGLPWQDSAQGNLLPRWRPVHRHSVSKFCIKECFILKLWERPTILFIHTELVCLIAIDPILRLSICFAKDSWWFAMPEQTISDTRAGLALSVRKKPIRAFTLRLRRVWLSPFGPTPHVRLSWPFETYEHFWLSSYDCRFRIEASTYQVLFVIHHAV